MRERANSARDALMRHPGRTASCSRGPARDRRALTLALVIGGGCYLVDLLAAFLVPDVSQLIHGFIVIPCAVAEIWMVGYLLIVGVRTVKADETVKPGEPVLTAV